MTGHEAVESLKKEFGDLFDKEGRISYTARVNEPFWEALKAFCKTKNISVGNFIIEALALHYIAERDESNKTETENNIESMKYEMSEMAKMLSDIKNDTSAITRIMSQKIFS